MRTKIYFLRGENHFVKYVGKTCGTLEHRLRRHLQEARNGLISKKCNGIRAMLRRGLAPTITLQTEVDGNGAKAEQAYIKWLRSKGIDLWNTTDGGEGVPGLIQSDEAKKKCSENHAGTGMLGKHHTENTKRKLRLLNLGKHLPIEIREKIRAGNKGNLPWNTGKHLSEEHKRKVSLAGKGRRHSREARIKMSLMHNQTALYKERLSKALKGRVFTLEWRKKLSESAKNRKDDNEKR